MVSESRVVHGSALLCEVVNVKDEGSVTPAQTGYKVREKAVFPEGWVVDVPAGGIATKSPPGRPLELHEQGFAAGPVGILPVAVIEGRDDCYG